MLWTQTAGGSDPLTIIVVKAYRASLIVLLSFDLLQMRPIYYIISKMTIVRSFNHLKIQWE